MIEVERKYWVEDEKQLRSKIKKQGTLQETSTRQIDTVYLRDSADFSTFKAGEPVIRLRQIGKKLSLTLKRLRRDGEMVEFEMAARPRTAAEGLISELGFHEVITIDKTRTTYQIGDVTVALDIVARLGMFVELEIVCEEPAVNNAIKKIKFTASQLGLSQKALEPKKYDVLIAEIPPLQ